MKLFKTLSGILGEGCSVTISIAQKDGQMTVGVLPGNNIVKDAAKSKIIPLNITGTPDELDEGFIDAIAQPVARTSGLLVDMAAYEKAEEEAKVKSKMEEERKATEAKKRKEFNAYVELARTNLKEEKYRDANTCVENARKSAVSDADKKVLDTLHSEIETASGNGALFGPAEDKSDGKNINPSAPKEKKTAKPSSEESDDNNEDNDD